MHSRTVGAFLGLIAFCSIVGARADEGTVTGFTHGTFTAEVPVSARTRRGGELRKDWNIGLDWNSFRCGEHSLSFERFQVRGGKSPLVSRDLAEGSTYGWEQAPVAWDWRLPQSLIPWRWSREQRSVLLGIEPDMIGQPTAVRLCGTGDGQSSDCATRLHGQGSLLRTGASGIRVWGGWVDLPVEGASIQKSTRWVGAFAIASNSEVVARFIPASMELSGLPSVELRGRMQRWFSFQIQGRLPVVNARGDVNWRDVALFGPDEPKEDSQERLSFGTVSEQTPSGMGGRNLGVYTVVRCD